MNLNKCNNYATEKNWVFKVNRCEVFRKANTKDKHMLGNIKNTSQILTKTINWTLPLAIELIIEQNTGKENKENLR